jgi:hypothetical protein
MIILDDADEHTGDALEQDPDSDSEAIILLSHRMAKAGEIKEDLNMAFDDELARHTRARDVQVTIEKFMMLVFLIVVEYQAIRKKIFIYL